MMARGRTLLLAGTALAFAGLVAIWFLRERSYEAADPGTSVHRSAKRVVGVTEPAPAPAQNLGASPNEGEVAAAEPISLSGSLAQRYRNSNNDLEFARSIHQAALAGDADAQYYLYRALNFCRGHYRVYFGRGRTYDQGLRWAARHEPGLSVEEARQVYQRCRDLVEGHEQDFGDFKEWSQKAAAGGQPLALLVQASNLSMSANDMSDEEAEIARENARDLIRQALESRDPEVIHAASERLHLRKGVPDTEIDTAAWWLAACARGFDCGPNSDNIRMYCRYDPNCQPYESLQEILRRQFADFTAVESMARDINASIDEGKWEELGFGEATADP